jgi:ribosomal protein L32
MSAIQFVENYDDLSTERGYQFKFHCDRCGNGYLSTFENSTLGTAAGLLSAAGSLFGGILGRAAQGSYEVQRAIGGKAHDAAVRRAVDEIKQKFKQCKRCGKWVCPEVCWNEKRQLCLGCAPDLAQETAAAQAQAQRDQVFQKAQSTNLIEDVDITREAAASCAKCGASVGAAKFCPECGTPVNQKLACLKCKAELSATAKFCPECGEPRRPAV